MSDSLLSIASDGVKGKIEISTQPGGSISTHSSKIYMKNVDQESLGGEIAHNAADLTQVGGSQNANSGGKIINRADGGTLHQENLTQSANDKGEIVNEVKKN